MHLGLTPIDSRDEVKPRFFLLTTFIKLQILSKHFHVLLRVVKTIEDFRNEESLLTTLAG
jgi:hypothetical protein